MNNRIGKNVTVEIVKKKRRRPLGFEDLGRPEIVAQDEELTNFLDLVKKDKEKKLQEEAIKKEEKQAELLEESSQNLASVEAEGPSDSSVEKKHHSIKAKPSTDKPYVEEESKDAFKSKLGVKYPIGKSKGSFDSKRSANKLLVQNVGFEEDREKRSIASIKRARDKARKIHRAEEVHEKKVRDVILPEVITVAELASRMAEKGSDVVRAFMKLGTIINLNQTIDADTAEIVVVEFGHKVKRVTEADVENILIESENPNEAHFVKRSPVVTIVGHVDHGKTSLLDALRETDVTSTEAGGITQHIGAYQVKLENDEHITFIDTPGHEAFTAMRSRGVNVTDIVVLVVAADDGVKAQTIEAINHAKAAQAPIIVAINKIDKEGADPSRVMSELLNYNIVAESMGGDVITVPVSALKKQNLDKLEEAILLQAEVLELKADAHGKAKGAVIESKLDKSIGVVATLLIQKGTLKVGDIVVAGTGFGKVKTMRNEKGQYFQEAYPSMPVEITGFDVTPSAGDNFNVVDEEKQAREICEYRHRKAQERKSAVRAKTSLEDLFTKASNNKSLLKEFPIIIKADVQGSIEAIHSSIMKIDTYELKVHILHEAIGGVNESDVSLAQASGALVIAFNVRANNNAKLLAEKEKTEIRYYTIIYELIDDLKRIMSGMLAPIKNEKYLGRAEIRQVFNITKVGKIAGAFVTDGMLKRGASVRLLRDNIILHTCKLKTLKRFKEDVKEVSNGYECGVAFENFHDIKEGDIVEAFDIIEEQRKI